MIGATLTCAESFSLSSGSSGAVKCHSTGPRSAPALESRKRYRLLHGRSAFRPDASAVYEEKGSESNPISSTDDVDGLPLSRFRTHLGP